jgi:hypothetical protein
VDGSSFCLSETAYFYVKASYACVEIVLLTYRSSDFTDVETYFMAFRSSVNEVYTKHELGHIYSYHLAGGESHSYLHKSREKEEINK